ncbi:tetraspanin-10 [Gasterosteus aculeatus]|uniref:Tetraspanin-10 n=1 Tax=Gasterosteus aculeatus aculeatus TaxID=481459 RepID=A0AAQ4Q5H8_GASAC|nr:tetraspanin-10 [Gasterosteus aculeatus aculeatus]
MRRNYVIERILWPWSRRDAAPDESRPLIPKVSPAKDGAEELGNVPADIHQAGPTGGRDDGPVFAGIRPRCRYSFVDYFLKYLLILSNLVFTVLSLMALVLGTWGLVSKQSFAREKIGSIGTDPMLVFLTAGSVLTLLCLSGCVGALRENRTLLKLFSAALLLLITAQVLTAIVAYGLQDQVVGYLRSGMLAAMVRYQDDLDLRFITDEIQSNLQCCGADNYRDWELNIYYNCSAPGVLACGVPATCCVDPLENGTVWNSQCGLGAQLLDEFSAQSVIFLGGCLGGISRWIEQHEGLIGTVAIVVVGVQILTLFITSRLLESIRWHNVYT